MAQNTKPGAAKKDDAPVQKGDKKIIILIGIIALLALIIAAGGGWYFAKQKKDTPHIEEVKIEPPKTPLFVILEPFTVNLQRESNDQYLQIGITLKVFEHEVEAKVKTSLPEIRSKILQLLTTKTATELLTAEGKQQLAIEIVSLGNSVIGINNEPLLSLATASQVSASAPAAPHSSITDAAPASAPGAEAALKTDAKKKAEQKGIIDVLFTSFIIQ